MRAEGGHLEADLPPLPPPSKAPYSKQEIDFEVPAYLESLIRAQAGGAGRSEEYSPPADDPSAVSGNEEEGDNFRRTAVDKAAEAFCAVLDDRGWDHIRQEEALRSGVTRVEALGNALLAALNTPGKAGRKSYASIIKDIKLQVDKLSEASGEAEKEAQVFYELELMKLTEE